MVTYTKENYDLMRSDRDTELFMIDIIRDKDDADFIYGAISDAQLPLFIEKLKKLNIPTDEYDRLKYIQYHTC